MWGGGVWGGEPPWGSGKGGMSPTDTHVYTRNSYPRIPWTQPCVPHHTPPSPTPASRRPFCFQLDHCLQEASARYKSLRFRGSVGPAQVHLVGWGAFRELRAALAARPSAPFPPEMPRVLKHRYLAQYLQRRVVS